MFSRAKSLKGLWGNVKFIVKFKSWATILIFAFGIAVGLLIPYVSLAETLEERLKRHEGVRHCVYNDVYDNPTIGVGHLLSRPVIPNMCWEDFQIERVLQHDIYTATHNAAADVGPEFYNLPDNVQNVLIELSFQLGGAGLSHFTTFLSLVRSGDYQAASLDLLGTKLAEQLPKRTREQARILRR